MKKLIALLVIGCFAGSVIAQNAPQQKPAGPAQNVKDKDKDKDHHRHHRHHREHKEVK